MRLLELYAEEFGLLKDRRFIFAEGLNLIEGANESGKSTLVALLRFLFYGFPRRGGEDVEERERRLSRTGRRAAGSVSFIWQGKAVVLHREYVLHTVGAKETPTERVQAFDRDTGAVFELGAGSAGEYFLSLPQALYHSSICVRQSQLEGVANGQTGDAVFEFLFGGSSGARLDAAVKILDEARRELQHQRGTGGRIPQLSAAQEELHSAISAANEAVGRLHALEREMQELEARVCNAQKRQAQLDGMLEALRIDGELMRYDEWHAARLRESAADDAYATALSMRDELPDTSKIEAAQAAVQGCDAAVQSQALCWGRYQEAQREVSSLAPRAAECCVVELGGVDATERHVRKLCRRVRTCGGAVLVCLLLSLLLAAGAVAVAAIRRPLGYACAASVLVGLFSWLIRVHAYKKQRTVLMTLGLNTPYMLRSFLKEYEKREVARTVAAQALTDVKRSYDEACAVCRVGDQTLTRSLADLGLAARGREGADAALSALVLHCRQTCREADEKRHALEAARSVCEVLGKGLDLDAESALRAARAKLPSPTQSREALCRERELLHTELQKMREMRDAIAREEHVLRARMGDIAHLREQWQKNESELVGARHRLAALKLAREALDEADATLRGGVMPRLAAEASAILAELTDGAYVRLHVPKGFEVLLETKEGIFPLSHFSAGARDVTYFALRIALLALLTSEPLPLLLDEVCAQLDDTRAANLLRFLSAHAQAGAQCLLFTCHTREAVLLGDKPYRRLVL